MSNAEVPERVCFFTGLNTDSRIARGLAVAAFEFGFGSLGIPVASYTLEDVANDLDGALEAAKGSFVGLHSAGHGILKEMLARGIEPSQIASFNPPGKTSEPRLVYGALKRFGIHAAKSITGPDAKANWKITTGTRLSITDPRNNAFLLPQISEYTSALWLQDFMGMGVPVATLTGSMDEFGATYVEEGEMMGEHNVTVTTCHDGVLLNPFAAFMAIDGLRILRRHRTLTA
jgi:hypothetical protein